MRRARIAAVVVVVALLVIAQRLGLLQQFADPAHTKRTLVELGPRGYAAFIGAFALLQPFGVPGTVFIFAAPMIWPWPTAFALSMTGTMAASVIGFSFARFVARDWIAGKIPARLRRYDDALATRAFATVFFLRLVLWMPPLLHAFFGVSKVRFSTHAYASAAGYVLPLLLVSYYGPRLFELAKQAPPSVWIATGAGALIVGGAVWLRSRRS
jgi:uncharacterized membrane protein YdjX (TVP38/TMEM64 family)